MAQFEKGKYYKSYGGDTVIQIVDKTTSGKSIYYQMWHLDPNETSRVLKRVKINTEGHEYFFLDRATVINAKNEACWDDFRLYLQKEILAGR